MTKKYTICLLLFLTVQLMFSQIETVYYPEGNLKEVSKLIDIGHKAQQTMTMPSFNAKALIDEDKKLEASSTEIPYRFGKAFDVGINVNVEENGKKSKNGSVWSREFYSKGAISINFVLSNLQLAEGAEMYLYNDSKTMIYGPVTSESNKKEGVFLTDLVFGERVTMYIKEPSGAKNSSRFTINRIVHGYRGYGGEMNGGTPGASEACNNDVACFLPEWRPQSQSVALILLSNGTEWCSGCLVNNTANDFRPFFLTAFHCADSNQNDALSTGERNNAEDWMFKFGFRRVVCTGSTIYYNWAASNGATFRAGWGPTDFLLMELDNFDEEHNYHGNISYAGWDRRANTPTSGASIHHPAGDLMKISIENNSFGVTSWGGVSNHWRVNFDDGVVQHGSSGSPLFNQNQRVVGQLHGNQAYNSSQTYCAQSRGEYGRFNVSWNGGGTNATRLRNWLDPCNSGAQTTNTIRGPYLTNPGTIYCTPRNVSVAYLPAGSTVTWSNSYNLTRLSSQGVNPASFKARGSGSAWVRATITLPNGCGPTYTMQRNITASGGSSSVSLSVYNSSGWMNANASGASGPYTWTIYANGGSTQLTTTSSFLSYNVGCNGGFIQVQATNTCGDTIYGSRSIPSCSPRGGGFEIMEAKVYPNPASDKLNIERIKNANSAKSDGNAVAFETVTLYDFAGIPVRSVKVNSMSDRIQIDVSNLKAGHYFLKIKGQGVDETHKIMVQ
ncbi:MAG: T9SS type A sorting domain-containing protein [Bacteroidota bacterium]